MKKFFDSGMPNVVSNINQIKISRRYKNNASEFITRNRASMILCIVLLLLGGLAGGAVYTWLPQDLKNQIFRICRTTSKDLLLLEYHIPKYLKL